MSSTFSWIGILVPVRADLGADFFSFAQRLTSCNPFTTYLLHSTFCQSGSSSCLSFLSWGNIPLSQNLQRALLSARRLFGTFPPLGSGYLTVCRLLHETEQSPQETLSSGLEWDSSAKWG